MSEPPFIHAAEVMNRKHPLAKCEICPLYDCKGPVPGDGPEGTVKIAVVGEAPGFHEALYGRPFVGQSGEVLDELLRNNDIKREDVWVTNAVMCRPEENATPNAAAIEACRPRLLNELIEAGPEYVIAAGAVAAKAMGLSGTMGKLRVGPPKHVTLETDSTSLKWDVKVIPTWHPAYAMRAPDATISIDLDISKAVKGTTATPWHEPALVVVNDWETAGDAINDLWEMPGPFSTDIETGVEKDDQEIHADQRPLLCIGIEYEPDKVVVFGKDLMDNQAFLTQLGFLFQEKPLTMHNGKSDVAGLFPGMGPVNLAYDTMLMHHALDERTGGHSLEHLGVELLGVPPWKGMVKPYLKKGAAKNFADIPLDVLYRYNAIDCSVTGHLQRMFQPILEEQGRMKLPNHTTAASRELVHLEMDGIGFDMPYSLDLTARYQDELSQLEAMINEYVGRELNPASPKQLLALFHDKAWYVPVEKRKETTAAPALARAREEGKYDEVAQGFLDLLFEHRRIAKNDGTFTRGMQKRAVNHGTEEAPDWRIHTTYTVHVATTGRLSSKDPNLQNIKDDKDLRRQFVAAPGNVLLQGDYSQVEGRVIAVLSSDQYLGDLFRNADRDIFDELSVAMYGKLIKEKRRLLKTFFYGISYGRTAHGIAKGFGMDVRDAQKQLDQFKELIPGVIEWQEQTWQTVQDEGYLETTFGRRRHFPLITNFNKTDIRNEALAFLPQSTASDICLRAFTRLRPGLETLRKYEKAEARIRLTIHDAIVVECREQDQTGIQNYMRQFMEHSGNEWATEQGSDVPFAVAFKAGPSWDQLGD